MIDKHLQVKAMKSTKYYCVAKVSTTSMAKSVLLQWQGKYYLAIIHSKVYCTAFLLQQQFLVVSVGAVLRNGILVGLPSEVVLQFKRGERQAIDEQYKVNLIGIHLRVHHLTDYAEDVVPVSHLGTGVQF